MAQSKHSRLMLLLFFVVVDVVVDAVVDAASVALPDDSKEARFANDDLN